ncbi:MAG: tetratricopeptide repeat protein [Hyphomicrobiaceae bacterium]
MPRTGILALVVALLAATPVRADDRTDCSSNNADLVIRSCTSYLNGSGLSSSDKAFGFAGRCWGYNEKAQYDDAIRDCSEAIRLDANLLKAWQSRCYAYGRKGDHDQAIIDCAQAIRIDPRSVWTYNERGWHFQAKGEHRTAIAHFNRAITLDARSAIAFRYRGYSLEMLGKTSDAIADYKKSLEIEPNDQWTKDAYKRLGGTP